MLPACSRRLGPRALLIGLALALLPSLSAAQVTPRCTAELEEHLEKFPFYEGEVKDIRIIERTNIADDFGPEVFGVDAWIRLNSCSGYLVLNLSRSCFLRQAYTRGDCSFKGLSNY